METVHHVRVGIALNACALAALAVASQSAPRQQGTGPLTIEEISLCRLTQDWRKYDHKIVRIKAIYDTGNETSEVYDPACPTSDHTAWVALLPYGSPSPISPELKEQLNELLKHSSRARITVVGEFDGPKKVDVSPALSPEAADAQRATNSRYGHRNQWEFQFVFSKVEKVDPVPSGVTWPQWKK
jgi:hypothetical protein